VEGAASRGFGIVARSREREERRLLMSQKSIDLLAAHPEEPDDVVR
jgi:hypothetical protein